MKSGQLRKNLIFYGIVVIVFLGLIYSISVMGADLEQQKAIADTGQGLIETPEIVSVPEQTDDGLFADLKKNLHHPLSILLIQIIVIIICSRAFAYVFNKIRQPAVIGEIIAGIVLGPSLLGLFFPEFSLFLFPVKSLPNLQFLSQIGLILFMFIIGMELDLSVLRKKAHSAVVVSHASIILPFFLGMGLALYLYLDFAPAGVDFLSFSLFMGIAMSVTAFPVLARILQERGWTKTPLGSLVITCAAADDVTAWCLLALVIALVKAGVATGALVTIALSAGYLGLMIFIVQPFMKKLGSIYVSKENLNKTIMGFIFVVLLASSFLTELIGIHALFGAFVAGVVMPQNLSFKKVLTEKVEDVSLVLLLPLFFVFTGLRTQIGLLNSAHLWLIAGLVIFIATFGKFVGSAVAAKITGQSWKDSVIIGVLMNTRGLMELVVLNIGYELGILSDTIFAILVIMALFTTFMAGPILEFMEYLSKRNTRQSAFSKEEAPFFKLLLSFGPPRMGATLMKLADKFVYSEKAISQVDALHMTADPEVSQQEAVIFEREGFQPIKKTATDLGVRLRPIYKLTDDIDNEIIKTCNSGKYDMLLIGGARSLFTENFIGGKVGHVLGSVNCDVGILIDKGINDLHQLLVFYTGIEDVKLLEHVQRMAQDQELRISILVLSDDKENFVQKHISGLTNAAIIEHRNIDKNFLDRFDLAMMGMHYWTNVVKVKSHWLSYSPSIFIIKSRKEG